MSQMKQKTVLIVMAATAVTLILAGAVLAGSAAASLDEWVIAGGGGRVTPGANTIEATIGQAAVGTISQKNFTLCAGYWCYEDYDIYLPLVTKP